MSKVAASSRVIVRNNIGRFISEIEAAGVQTVDAVLDEGVDLSRSYAPEGSKSDPRTTPLKESFYVQKMSATSGAWGNFARHALAIERGARPHPIVGSPFLGFYWDNAHRRWVPGLFGEPDVVNHPGNAAQPFMRPAYEVVMSRAMQIARRYYPGSRV